MGPCRRPVSSKPTLVGGIRNPRRLVNEGYSCEDADLPKVQCRLCGNALGSEEHRTYECDATQRALCHRFPHDKHANAFAIGRVEAARSDLAADRNYECLWLRGLPPLGMLPRMDRQSPEEIIIGDAALADPEWGCE